MTLSDREGYAILATALAFLAVGFATGRAVFALLAALGGGAFLAVTIASGELYSRIPEDVQITVVLALFLGTATALVGVLMRRVLASERRRRARTS